MERRLEIATKGGLRDVLGEQLSSRLRAELGLTLSCRYADAYSFAEPLGEGELETLCKDVFCDAVAQVYSISEPLFKGLHRIEVGYLPGVTDNVGRTASEAVIERLGRKAQVFHSRIYAISGELDAPSLDAIAKMLHNPLTERFLILGPGEDARPNLPIVSIPHEPTVMKYTLHMSERRFAELAKQRMLALNPEEFRAIKLQFRKAEFIEERKKVGLDNKITDVELECIAQTWSEHCKHKIFNALISYDEEGEKHAINSLFKTFIRGATEQAKKPYIVSVFKDNGGIIKLNHQYDLALKVETHNAPSALDPYGGALTGVLGVQRDIMGTGMGANPIANLDMLCFGPLDTPKDELPRNVLHPKTIFEGVVKGIEHAGNKMGIPTVNGSITFDRGYTARPLVYCGTLGIMPSIVAGKRSSEKNVKPGDLAIVVGGRVGKDGIHGATFSSMQIDSSVPQSVVQIGDPITQKKTLDFILEARDAGLYEAITDNGAGGISSSIGEMAQLSGGCKIYLERNPLKYPGLDPWEILLSESQERMTIATDPKNLPDLRDLAKTHGVELSVVGEFTDSGFFHVLYEGQSVAYLEMGFLHEGVPQLKLSASWKKLIFPEPLIGSYGPSETLLSLLSSPDIATKEGVIRRFDHEVKGMSVIKPIMLGPSDAAVIRPLYDSNEGVVLSHGICPRYIQDGYSMASMAFDEAVRNAIAAGARFGYLAALDNFSWPDPVLSQKTPDGEQKLGHLVRSCIALYDCATSYGIPLISGKDSMKNDYYDGENKHSIPPTLLITMVGKIDDISKAMSSELKDAGDYIFVLGTTHDELGGSQFYRKMGAVGNRPPALRPEEHIPLYRALSSAIEEGALASVHDVSDGGLAVAFAESAMGIGVGADMDLSLIPKATESQEALLFSESPGRFIVSVRPQDLDRFERMMEGCPIARAGRVRGDKRFIVRRGDQVLINLPVESLREAFSKGV